MKEEFKNVTLEGEINIKLEKGRRWVADKNTVCGQVIAVLDQFSKAGFKLTLRQLYYQLVAKEWIPNHLNVYKRLSGILDDLRYGGVVDWNAIEDRGRVPILSYSVRDIEHALSDTANQYRLNRQEGQEIMIELWTEKDAISGILRRAIDPYHIRLVVNKGYSSSSAMHRAYQRFVTKINMGRKVKILYFGDFDPSGLDMIRDIRDRISYFLAYGLHLDIEDKVQRWWEEDGVQMYHGFGDEQFEQDLDVLLNSSHYTSRRYDKADNRWYKQRTLHFLRETETFEVIPVGLTMEQIELYNPPPNPAKMTDSRAPEYVELYGYESWEVDALSPQVMMGIVRTNVEGLIDMNQFKNMVDR